MVVHTVIPALEACRFEASLGYIVRPVSKIKTQTNKKSNPSYLEGGDQKDLNQQTGHGVKHLSYQLQERRK
jgi:hypothetical protein